MDTKLNEAQQQDLPYSLGLLPGPPLKTVSRSILHYVTVALALAALVFFTYDNQKYFVHEDGWSKLTSRVTTRPVGTLQWGTCAQPSLSGTQCGYLVYVTLPKDIHA